MRFQGIGADWCQLVSQFVRSKLGGSPCVALARKPVQRILGRAGLLLHTLLACFFGGPLSHGLCQTRLVQLADCVPCGGGGGVPVDPRLSQLFGDFFDGLGQIVSLQECPG
jgi:hypothetical protein